MLLGRNKHAAYKSTKVNANVSVANSFELNFMLHERLESELKLLESAISAGEIEKKARHSNKCISILMALDNSLDLDQSNELIQTIHGLYESSIACVYKASVDMDAKQIEPCFEISKNLKEGWQGLVASAA